MVPRAHFTLWLRRCWALQTTNLLSDSTTTFFTCEEPTYCVNWPTTSLSKLFSCCFLNMVWFLGNRSHMWRKKTSFQLSPLEALWLLTFLVHYIALSVSFSQKVSCIDSSSLEHYLKLILCYPNQILKLSLSITGFIFITRKFSWIVSTKTKLFLFHFQSHSPWNFV